jgi:hypothetical protein
MNRRAIRDDDRDRPRRRGGPRSDAGNTAITLLIVGAVIVTVLLVFCGGGIALFLLVGGRVPSNAPAQAASKPPRDDSALFGPAFDPPRNDPAPPRPAPDPPRRDPIPPRNRPPAERPAGPKDAKDYAADLQGDHFTAKAAMEALIGLSPKAEPEVIPYLNHDDFNVRHRSAQVIEKIGTAASLPELRKVISAGRSVFGASEQALAAIRQRERLASGEPAPKPPTPSEEAKRAAADLPGLHSAAAAAMKKLIAMGPAAEGAVIPYLDHSNFSARHRAAQVIEKIGTAASLAELQRVIDAKRSVFGACEKAIVAIEEREEAAKKKP